MREVSLAESPADRLKRIADNQHGEIHAQRDQLENVRSLMAPKPLIERGGGTKKRGHVKRKRGTTICPSCNIELTKCTHRPLPGRPKNTEPTVPARVYIPQHLIKFLDDSRLRLGDVLDAVLESPAVKCWKRHIPSMGHSRTATVVDSDGEEREQPYTALHRERQRRGQDGDEETWSRELDFLAQLGPTDSKRCDRLVPARLLDRADQVGRANKDDSFRYGKYSRSRFVAWAIKIYESYALYHQMIQSDYVVGGTQIRTSRDEIDAVKAHAVNGCPWCAGVTDVEPRWLRAGTSQEARLVDDVRKFLKPNVDQPRIRAPRIML